MCLELRVCVLCLLLELLCVCVCAYLELHLGAARVCCVIYCVCLELLRVYVCCRVFERVVQVRLVLLRVAQARLRVRFVTLLVY